MGRTHQVSHYWLHEVINNDPAVTAVFCDTREMRADLMTKQFLDEVKWNYGIKLVGVVPEPTGDLAKRQTTKRLTEQQRLIDSQG